ncbi:MAG: CoA-acylating methylmalonate-semialdehyde dehydrogenase [Candidatus Thorarchaeota archaeon SMTZ1-45]|nr:MAG: methylmalonate-semialdehyde dehydrogenase [Candidatus Thorarchaeota archaeon SMTZ1-45]
MTDVPILKNYIDGEWVESSSKNLRDVLNPATGELIAKVPMSTVDETEEAIQAANKAFPRWRRTIPITRARYFFEMKNLMEEKFEELARQVVIENGKTIDEARGEIRRGIENVEVATGIPSLMMGYNAEDVAPEIDEIVLRQPMGVFFCLAPFNFPSMVPLWFLPAAVACGNTYIVKPSPIAPISAVRLTEVIDESGFPPGVINLVHGDVETANTLLDSPITKGVSFVGSTPVGRIVYERAAAHGKRAQVQAGAKNFLLVMPDADLERTASALMTSCYGCAGERCLAGAVILAMEEIHEPLVQLLVEKAKMIRVGNGLEEGVQMGPLITAKSKARTIDFIERGLKEGATLLLDGRDVKVDGHPNGFFVGPTIFDDVKPNMGIAQEEIFGPVMSIIKVKSYEEAIKIIHANPYGNASSIFTSSGKWAREFTYEVQTGNIGINIGIAAPVAHFPFSGMKDSFFGDLHGQGTDAIRFFTEDKVVITRWF